MADCCAKSRLDSSSSRAFRSGSLTNRPSGKTILACSSKRLGLVPPNKPALRVDFPGLPVVGGP